MNDEVFTVYIASVSGCGSIGEYMERLNLSGCLMIVRGIIVANRG